MDNFFIEFPPQQSIPIKVSFSELFIIIRIFFSVYELRKSWSEVVKRCQIETNQDWLLFNIGDTSTYERVKVIFSGIDLISYRRNKTLVFFVFKKWFTRICQEANVCAYIFCQKIWIKQNQRIWHCEIRLGIKTKMAWWRSFARYYRKSKLYNCQRVILSVQAQPAVIQVVWKLIVGVRGECHILSVKYM